MAAGIVSRTCTQGCATEAACSISTAAPNLLCVSGCPNAQLDPRQLWGIKVLVVHVEGVAGRERSGGVWVSLGAVVEVSLGVGSRSAVHSLQLWRAATGFWGLVLLCCPVSGHQRLVEL